MVASATGCAMEIHIADQRVVFERALIRDLAAGTWEAAAVGYQTQAFLLKSRGLPFRDLRHR